MTASLRLTDNKDASKQALLTDAIEGCFMSGVGDTSANSIGIAYDAIVTPVSEAVTNTAIASPFCSSSHGTQCSNYRTGQYGEGFCLPHHLLKEVFNVKKKRILALFLAAVSCLSLAVSRVGGRHDYPQSHGFQATIDRIRMVCRSRVSAAVDNGLLYGKSSTIIDPNGDMTRAEMAAIINRSFGCYKAADISQYKDVCKNPSGITKTWRSPSRWVLTTAAFQLVYGSRCAHHASKKP